MDVSIYAWLIQYISEFLVWKILLHIFVGILYHLKVESIGFFQ